MRQIWNHQYEENQSIQKDFQMNDVRTEEMITDG